MIKRNYFYLADTQEEKSKFMYGIISVRSFFPNPKIALKTAKNHIMKCYRVSDKEVKIKSFNKI